MPTKKPTTKRKTPARSSRKTGWLASSKVRALLVALIVGLVGASYLVYQTFAASNTVKYFGVLSAEKPSASYKVTTGSGKMNVKFSNNTAELTLNVTNSAGKSVGSIKSVGKQDVSLALTVVPDTYTFSLKIPATSKTAKHGYKVEVAYPTGDVSTPTAVITKPLSDVTVAGTVDFSANSQDDVAVTKVEFYVGGALLQTDTTAPYSVKWDTTTQADGPRSLSVKAYDESGNVGVAAGTTTVKNKTTPNPNPSGQVEFGMSAPRDLWAQRLKEVGGPTHIKYRRIFLTGLDANLTLVKQALDAGMTPIISYKLKPYSWADVAAGKADNDLRQLVKNLDAVPGNKFVALHHEPNGDGNAKDYANMNIHALPIIKTAKNVEVGVIGNGWWWSNRSQGLSDAEIAQWIPQKLVDICDVVASDTYQDPKLNESGGPKAKNMAAWGKRVGAKALGVGEFNGLNPAGITEAMNAVKSEPLFKWALLWNSVADGVHGTPLEGARLDAFKKGLATPNQT